MIQFNNIERIVPPQAAASHTTRDCPEEGSPRKMMKTDSPQHIRIRCSPEAMVISPIVTSASAAYRTSRIQRSHSTAYYHTYASPLSYQEIRKSYSATSIQRTSFSDDSGFQSEVSSPDMSQSMTTTSPTTTIAGRKVQRIRRSRGSQPFSRPLTNLNK